MMAMDIYHDKRWRPLRERILRRDKYMCQHSKRYGKRIDANTVHHIYPVEHYPQYAFAAWNLVALSTDAHNKMHDRDTHELTIEGSKLQERTPLPLRFRKETKENGQ